MYKLIFMDLDGTLLRGDKTVSAYTLSVIEKCRALGVLIGISTARGESNALTFLSALHPDVVISCSGALITYKGEPIYTKGFSAEETALLIRTAQELTHGECEIAVDTLEKYYWNYKVPPREVDASWGEAIYTNYADFCEPSLKICVELPDEALAREIAERVGGCDCTRFSGDNWYKFTPNGVTKGSAVREVAARLAIPEKEMLAFGDDFVDMEMLQICGRGVAMGNAVSVVKACADDVAESNDNDGVARYLEALFLKE